MIVLRNVNLVDVINLRIIERVNLVVEQGVIASICDKDHTILEDQACSLDLDGYFATPGLIDLHTHLIWSAGDDPVKTVEDEGPQLSLLRAAHNARLTLNQGITCVRDLGSNDDATIALAKSIERGYVPGPRVISAGCTIIMTGGHDPFWGIAADGPFELVKAVRNQIRKGARVIKISATGGVYGRQEGEEVGTSELTCEEIRAICQEAHRFGLKVAAHAISEEGIRNCIEAGVDTIEHGHFLTQEMMLRMKENRGCSGFRHCMFTSGLQRGMAFPNMLPIRPEKSQAATEKLSEWRLSSSCLLAQDPMQGRPTRHMAHY